MLSPALDFVYEQHDNIYYQPENPVSDDIYHLRPRISLASGWSRHALSFDLSGDFASYDNAGKEDFDDLTLAMDARIDIRRGKYLSFSAARVMLHEDRSSPDDPGGIEPTGFDNEVFAVGYHHLFNRLVADLSYRWNTTNYDGNLDAGGGFIDNRDRDRGNENMDLRLSYQIMPQRSAFLGLSRNTVDYDLPADNEGFVRDSEGYQIQAGMTFDITGVLNGGVWLERVEQDYDDPRFRNQDDTGMGFELEWSPTRLTTLSLRSDRGPLESTQPNSSGYIGKLYSLRLQHELRRYLLLHARVSYTDNDYGLTPEAADDTLAWAEIRRGELGLSYLFNPSVSLTVGYSREKQDANLAVEQYQANRFFLTLGLAL